jgi:hypothetical protein
MKLVIRTFLLLFILSFGLTSFAQTPASATESGMSTQKSNKRKKKAAKATPAAAEAVSAPSPAPAAAVLTPAATTTPTTMGPDGVMVAQTEAPAAPALLTTIAFEEVSYDFGKIKEGDVVKHKFKFTNTGTNDLILENVKPSCGCTALDWPKDPIAPGKSAEIEAQFNSSGKSGAQMKYITITLNSAERLERITFTGEVIPKATDGVAPAPAPSTGH